MIDLKKLIEDAAAVQRESSTLDVSVAKRLITVKVTEMAGPEWSALAAQFPPSSSQTDLSVGCNIRAMLPTALEASAVVVDGGDEQKTDVETWQSILTDLSGVEYETVASTVIDLNIWSPANRLATLKKGRLGSLKQKPDLPDTSESPRDDSQDGSPSA